MKRFEHCRPWRFPSSRSGSWAPKYCSRVSQESRHACTSLEWCLDCTCCLRALYPFPHALLIVCPGDPVALQGLEPSHPLPERSLSLTGIWDQIMPSAIKGRTLGHLPQGRGDCRLNWSYLPQRNPPPTPSPISLNNPPRLLISSSPKQGGVTAPCGTGRGGSPSYSGFSCGFSHVSW